MGVDLTLFLFYTNCACFSLTALDCCRRDKLFDKIVDIEEKVGRNVPKDFHTWGEKNIDENPYGSNTNYVTVKDLSIVHEDISDNCINRAIWAFLSQLPEDMKIALYWH